jgi:hypothetical protein
MTQPIENKEPGTVLIAHFSRKLAPLAPAWMRWRKDSSGTTWLWNAAEHKPPRYQTKRTSFSRRTRTISPRHVVRRSIILWRCVSNLRAPIPSRAWLMRRLGVPESQVFKPQLGKSYRGSGSSSLQPLRPVGWRSLARAHSVAPSCHPQARSGSTSRSFSRRMPRGPFRTNLAELSWSGSSAIINLLVVNLAASAFSRRRSLRNQGSLRASKTTHGLNCFLLRPTAFHHAWLQGSGGYALRGLTDDSGLFFSDLRLEDFLLFFAAIAVLLCSPATQADSAIRRPNVSSRAKLTRYRCEWTYAKQNSSLGLVRSAPRW